MSTPVKPPHSRPHPASPASPTASSRPKNPVLPGFRAPPKPKARPLTELTARELRDRHRLNARILQSPEASTSSYAQRISAEQAAIESRLLDLEGVDTINRGLKNTRITGDDDMNIDSTPDPPISRTREAKARALAQFGSSASRLHDSGSFTLQQAMELEQRAFLQEREREQRLLEKRKLQGLPIPGEILTREEQAARIYAFMNYKGSDDEDDDEDDEDPASWFEDDQDDGRKGQNIVDPDPEDLYDVIRIDPDRIPYSSWYPDRDDGD
ncbi:hypothetical protein AX16_000266 [Volvariella volvacea WC 439]|nr:hypothetical protein AX16_000266 [Volvariella volvacea WC 439]